MLLLNNCFYQLWLCIFWCVLASIAFFAKVLACYRCRRFLWAASDYFGFSGIPSVLSGEMCKRVWWDELYYVGKEEFELLLSTFLLFWLLEHWVFFRCFRLVSFFLIALWSDIRTSPRCNRDSFYLWTFPRWFIYFFSTNAVIIVDGVFSGFSSSYAWWYCLGWYYFLNPKSFFLLLRILYSLKLLSVILYR